MTAPPCPSTEALSRDPNLCPLCGHWCGLKCERPFEWNPRFLAYCALDRADVRPEAVLAIDREVHPGGRMTRFIVWCRAQVSDWQQWTKNYGPLDHAAFDKWLQNRVSEARVQRSLEAATGHR